ncbi:MAG: cobalamin-dependent protein [Anaerovoracaceae bacterium]
MLDKIAKAVEDYEIDDIVGLVNEAKVSGIEVTDILNLGLVKGMDAMGKKFASGEVFVPEVLMAANTMQAGLEVIEDELIAEGNVVSKGTIVIGTVAGDLHDIGKKLVGMMIKGAGFNVIDLGVDVSVDKFIEAVEKNDADYIGMSAMLTTTMTEMDKIVKALKAKGLKTVPLIGGAPVNNGYAKKIGAYYSHDAVGAVDLVKTLKE